MLIMASTLYRDTLNFLRNQFANIILLSLLSAIVIVIINQALLLESDQLILLGNHSTFSNTRGFTIINIIRQMSPEQQRILLQNSAASTIAGLIGNVLLTSSLLIMISHASNYKPISILRTLILSVPLLPRLLLLTFFTTLLVQIGMLFLIVPGILLAFAFSLAPVIIIQDKLSILKAMHLSAKLAFANIHLIAPALIFWLLAKTVVVLLATVVLPTTMIITKVLLNSLSNLISAMLIIYLFRLYMLLYKI